MLLFCACNVYVSKSKFAIVKEHSDYSVPCNENIWSLFLVMSILITLFRRMCL